MLLYVQYVADKRKYLRGSLTLGPGFPSSPLGPGAPFGPAGPLKMTNHTEMMHQCFVY